MKTKLLIFTVVFLLTMSLSGCAQLSSALYSAGQTAQAIDNIISINQQAGTTPCPYCGGTGFINN